MSTLRDRLAAMLPKRTPKPPPEADPAGVIPKWLIWQAKALAWLAMASLVYFMWLFSLDAARDTAQALHLTRAGTWSGDVQFWFPTIFGFLLIAIGVPWLGKIVIPAFVSLRWKEPHQGWPKAWLLVLTITGSAVIIMGSVTVQTETRFERNRDGVVVEQQGEAERTAIGARLSLAKEELARISADNLTTYQAQAARDGAAAWARRIEIARTQKDANARTQLPSIERAMASAERADQLRADIERLTVEQATAAPAAATAARVSRGAADDAMGGFVDWLASVRAIALAVLMDIVCLLMPWIAMRLEQARQRQLAAIKGEAFVQSDGTIDESHMIRDMRAQDAVEPQPMEPSRDEDSQLHEVIDGETGERLIRVREKKVRDYWRKSGKKKGERGLVGPVVEPDEPGMVSDIDPRTPAGAARAEEEEAARAAARDMVSRLDGFANVRPLEEPAVDVEVITSDVDPARAEAEGSFWVLDDDTPPEGTPGEGMMVDESRDLVEPANVAAE